MNTTFFLITFAISCMAVFGVAKEQGDHHHFPLVKNNVVVGGGHNHEDKSSPIIPPRHLIVGGEDAESGRYPYYVRLDWMGVFICGGTLIRRDFMLTAAHCAKPYDLGYLNVTIGAYTNNDTSATQTKAVTKIIRHPTYSDLWSDINDFALLQIEPVDETVPIITLNQNRSEPTVGTPVTVIGLGLTTEGGAGAETLQEVALEVLADEMCDARWKGEIHRKSMICASAENKDSCQGDSGGPLIVLGDSYEDDLQVGVVSFGEKCGSDVYPGVYADISYQYEWIDETLCQYSMDPPVGCKNATTSIIIGEGEECRDYPGAFYASWWFQYQRCDWLAGKIDIFCYKHNEAWVQCPFTCHSCTYGEEDEGDSWYTDDEPNYNHTFSPLIMPFLLIMSCCACCCCPCMFGIFQCGSRRRKNNNN